MNRDLLFKIKALMTMRVIVVSLILVIILLFQSRFSTHPVISPVTALIALTYLLTLFYALFLPVFKNLTQFAYFQLFSDLFVESGIIFFTGGVYSPFNFMYILSIISASIILFRQGGFWVASLSCILYALLTNFELYGLIHPLYIYPISTEPRPGFIFYNLALNIAAFYIVAYLSGYLAENLRKTGKELEVKSEDFLKLKTYNEVVLENMGSGLIATNAEGNILSINMAVGRITGFTIDDLGGKSVFNLFNISEKLNPADGNLNMPARHEVFFKCRGEKRIFLGITQSLLQNNHNFYGYIFVFQDLTEMKNMERKVANSERQAAIGRVAAGIAHEIRNPLASLSGSIQMLRNRLALNDTDRKLMEIILRETERLNGIIVDFLQYAAPRETKKTRCDLLKILNETIVLLTNHPGIGKEIRIERSIPETGFHIYADPMEIRQVVWNLCLNGIEAMENSGILAISVKESGVGDKKLGEVYIIDHGVGIKEEDLKTIYEPFFTTKADGTGLGLSTVFRIMEENNGTINITSEGERGTTALIAFPLLA